MQADGSRSLKARAAEFATQTLESTCACAVVMVQGQLLLLTATHWLIAAQTGLIAGAISTTLLTIGRAPRPWVLSVVLGVATFIADFMIHSGELVDVLTEALVTGVGAAVLAYAITHALRWLRRRVFTRG
jgi:hypothetical protein